MKTALSALLLLDSSFMLLSVNFVHEEGLLWIGEHAVEINLFPLKKP
jgi:hypothetical protein